MSRSRNSRKIAFLELVPAAGVDHQDAHVGAVEHLPGLLHPLFAQRPWSSMPAVSMNSTGPSGSSSIGFSTGSVVVPATSETMETSCRVIAFNSDDLPALRRPNRPMCRRRPLGVFAWFIIAFVAIAAISLRASDPSLVTRSRRSQLVELLGRQQPAVDRPTGGCSAGRIGWPATSSASCSAAS